MGCTVSYRKPQIVMNPDQRMPANLAPVDHPSVHMPTADMADAMWKRWASGTLPMVQATVRPEGRVRAVNDALVRCLGYTSQEAPAIVKTILNGLQSVADRSGAATSEVPDARLARLELMRRDGTTVSLRMILVTYAGRQSNELAVVGVGLPASPDLATARTIPLSPMEQRS